MLAVANLRLVNAARNGQDGPRLAGPGRNIKLAATTIMEAKLTRTETRSTMQKVPETAKLACRMLP